MESRIITCNAQLEEISLADLRWETGQVFCIRRVVPRSPINRPHRRVKAYGPYRIKVDDAGKPTLRNLVNQELSEPNPKHEYWRIKQ